MNTHVVVISKQRHFCSTCADIILNHCCMCLIWLLSILGVFFASARELVLWVCACLSEYFQVLFKLLHSYDSIWGKAEQGANFPAVFWCFPAPSAFCIVHACVLESSCCMRSQERDIWKSLRVCTGVFVDGIPLLWQIFTSPRHWSVSDRPFVFQQAGHSSKAAIKSRTFSPIIPLTWTPTPSPADVPGLDFLVAHFCEKKGTDSFGHFYLFAQKLEVKKFLESQRPDRPKTQKKTTKVPN